MVFGRQKPSVPLTDVDQPSPQAEGTVPPGLRIAGAYSWRILLVVGVIAVVVFLVIQFRYIVVPLMIAVLVAALLVPLVNFLVRHHWPKGAAVAVAMVGTIAVVSALIYLIVTQIRREFPDLQERSLDAFQDFRTYLGTSPLGLSQAEINGYLDQAVSALQDSQILVTGAVSIGSTAGHIIAGLLLALFATLFILIDGQRIWAWVVSLFPRRARTAFDGSGHAGWVTLTTFVKVQIFVAAVDAVGIGLGAWILGLVFGGFPLIIPITIAVFLGSFIPVVGAVFTGSIAIFVALVYLGPIPALIMLGIVLLVQQVEGHVLQPLIMGTAVKIHPLAVVFAVAAGSFTAGIAGALFAVPIVAVMNVMIKYIAGGAWKVTTRPSAEELLPRA